MADPELFEPRPDDWAAYRDLRLRALRDAPLAFLEKLPAAEALGEVEWRARIAPRDSRRVLVARDDAGAWLGSMIVYTDDRVDAWLVAVWVAPEARGTGLAERMLRDQVAWARDVLGARRLILHVGGTNPRARALYERVGFRATGQVDHFADHPEDEHVLELPLHAPLVE